MAKITQIVGVGNVLIVLTDKGSLYYCWDIAAGDWRPIPIPDLDKIYTPKAKNEK